MSGDDALLRGISAVEHSEPIIISLRLSKQGLTLTDVHRRK